MHTYLLASTGAAFLSMWFLASVGLVLAVTAVYVFVLNKSPPPEVETVAKIDSASEIALSSGPDTMLNEAQTALNNGDVVSAVEISVRVVSLVLGNILKVSDKIPESMNISDMAYLVQTKTMSSTDISQPIYQLNLLRLKVLQGGQASAQEADWAVRTASWLVQLAGSNKIAN